MADWVRQLGQGLDHAGSRSVNSASRGVEEAVAGVILDNLEAKAVPLRLMPDRRHGCAHGCGRG